MIAVRKVPRSMGTHDGTFHADEVTACALLLLFDRIDKDKITRTRDLEKLKCCDYVCDVGGSYEPKNHIFDHHQVDYEGDMSSAGMILLHLKDEKIIEEDLHRFLHGNIIKGVDDHDNGEEPQIYGLCTYSHVITNFNPVHHDCSDEEENQAFFEALDFAYYHLNRVVNRYRYICECREVVAAKMAENSEVLIFDKSIPWLESFFDLGGTRHPAKFVIMPSGNHWKLRGIPPDDKNRMDVRIPQPKEWAGLLDSELKRVSGIKGAIFCHKGRFISVWETRQDALEALKYTLQNSKEMV